MTVNSRLVSFLFIGKPRFAFEFMERRQSYRLTIGLAGSVIVGTVWSTAYCILALARFHSQRIRHLSFPTPGGSRVEEING